MNLPNDIARCDGRAFAQHVPDGIKLLYSTCENCLRRIAPRPEYVWMMGTPEFIDGKCPVFIIKLGEKVEL